MLNWCQMEQYFTNDDERREHRTVYSANGVGGRNYMIKLIEDQPGVYNQYLYINGRMVEPNFTTLTDAMLYVEMELEPQNVRAFYLASLGEQPLGGLASALERYHVSSPQGAELCRLIETCAAGIRFGDDRVNIIANCCGRLSMRLARYRSAELRGN